MTTTIPINLQPLLDEQPYPLLFASITGAHHYGFPSPDSDYDVRGSYVVPVSDALSLGSVRETVHSTTFVEGVEIDLVMHDVKTFMLLLLKNGGNMIEQVFSPLVLVETPYLEPLREIVPGCITRFYAYHYLGFAGQQWKDFQKQDEKRVKMLLYCYRVLLTGLHLMRTGEVQPNLPILADMYKLDYVPELIAAKTGGSEFGPLGHIDVDFHTREYRRLTRELEEARETTHLPEHPARKDDVNDLLITIRKDMGAD